MYVLRCVVCVHVCMCVLCCVVLCVYVCVCARVCVCVPTPYSLDGSQVSMTEDMQLIQLAIADLMTSCLHQVWHTTTLVILASRACVNVSASGTAAHLHWSMLAMHPLILYLCLPCPSLLLKSCGSCVRPSTWSSSRWSAGSSRLLNMCVSQFKKPYKKGHTHARTHTCTRTLAHTHTCTHTHLHTRTHSWEMHLPSASSRCGASWIPCGTRWDSARSSSCLSCERFAPWQRTWTSMTLSRSTTTSR